jgi:hypothetical protein
MKGPEERRRAEIVVAHVVDDVAHVHPEPDHRRLMRDTGDTLEAATQRVFVLERDPHVLRRRVEIRGHRPVRVLFQAIEDSNVVPIGDELVHDVRADESRPSRDQDAMLHGANLAPSGSGKRAWPKAVRRL